MSSSVFVETPRPASESLLNGDSTVANADSNLVVVYGKNGINVDRKGLENLIDEKTLTSISVIRITSPTQSMQDEEEEEIRKEVERSEDDGEKSVASDDEDDEVDHSDSEDTEKVSKPLKTAAKTRPQILGLTVEEFYPPDAAKELAKEILKYAGVTPLKCNVDYEFQRYTIQNDHCYTPYTSPSQLNKAKPFEEDDDKHQQSVVRKPPGTGTTVKQYLNKRKQLMDEKQRKLNEKERSVASASDNEELAAEDERINESQEDEADEDLDEDDSDYSEGSEKSAESENDRDSDLDFDVNNRHGRKRKPAAVRRKKKERKDKKEKQRARSVMMQKANNKRRQQSQDNNTHDDETKVVLTPMKVNRQPLDARKSISAFNLVKGIARKQMPENVDIPVSGPPLPPHPSPAAVSSTQSKPLINIQSIQVIPAPKTVAIPAKQIVAFTPKPTVSIAPAKPVVAIPSAKPVVAIPAKPIVANPPKPIEVAPVKQKPITSPTVPQSPQTVKQIVINKVIASPKGGFTDLSTLLARSDNLQSNLRVKEIKPDKPASASPVKGFMRLGIDTAAKNQLPAQISIQTHQSSSEIAAENDKQLDLIDSIVKDEMEKSFKGSEKPPMKENSIPDLVKMLESTEKAVLEKNKLSSSFTSSSVEAIDIANAPLLETPDDEIPDDLLQHVVELMEDKSLQEAVEKEVLQQQQKQQQQKQQQQPNKIHLPQPQIQQIILSQPMVQPVRQPQIVTTAVMKQPKSIIEASISNTTTPSSSRDTTPTPTLNRASNLTFMRKEPIQIVRGNGRVITLPPIEAPTTRAKRRAQAQPSADISFNDSESCDVSMHSDTSIFADTSVLEKSEVQPVITPLKERAAVVKAATGSKKKTATRATKAAPSKSNPEQEESQEDEDEDDPNKLWCICRQPHNNRFMICCDVCEDWFHGTCVSITKAMGLEMELKGVDWTCPKCVKKQETRKQRKITDIFDKKPIVQDVPKIDDPPKPAAVPTQSTTSTTITVTELPAEKRHLIDFKKLQPGQFYAITKVDTTKKVQSLLETSSIVTTVTATPTTSVATTSMTPEPVQKKLTDLSVKKTTEPAAAAAAATTSNVTTKRVIVLPSTAKTTTSRGMTMVKASAAQQQQQLKFTKVPTAAEKKQFTVTKAQQQQQQQNKNVTQTTTTAEGEISEGNQKVPPQKQASTELLTCIVCKKSARANSIYCSDDCIRKHAQNALINVSKNAVKSPEPVTPLMPVKLGPDEKKKKNKGLFEDLLSMADRKPKVERVYVFERRTGRILTGNNAPTTINLKKWLQDNPTFEVVQPGSPQAMEVERSKQKTRLSMQSPTNTNSTFMPLKADGAVVTSVITISPPVISTPPPVLPKIIKVQVDNKSNTKPAHSPTIHQPQRTSTPKQLPKYPQQVSIKPDKATSSPSHKVLKKQVSAEKESPVAQTPNRTEFEPVRVNVRRTLKEQLVLRMNDLADDSKLTTEQVEEFVKATELEMYRLFNKDIGTKYKAKYRSLMFNIKDRKNETLIQKICGKLIEPRQLVRMSPEEMASQELAQWRENEAKHQLEMIKKSELDMLSCAKNYVLKTHKGEEVIEGKATDRVDLDISIPVEDVVTVLNNATVSSTTEIEASLVTPRKDHSFDLESSMNFAQEVTPSLATSSSDKKKASSKERDKEKRHKSKDRHREKSRKRSRSRSRERHHKSASRKDERRDKEERIVRKDDHDLSAKHPRLVAPLKVVVPPPTSTVVSKPAIIPTKLHKEREVGVKKSTKAPIEKFNLIDQILESTKTVEEAANLLKNNGKKEPVVAATANTSTPTSTAPLPPALQTLPAPPSNSNPHSPSAMDSDQEPSSTVSISTPPEDPYYKYSSEAESSIWTGSINMIDVASYQVSVQTVSGNTYLLSKDLPEELDVVGRISPDTVWDYIGKIKRSPNKEIVIIRLVPAAESENVAYTILYKYLDKRKRLGVIKTTSPNIKDFYIMPLGVGQQMPSVLQPNENFEFYEDTMRPDMLLGIVIRIMGKRHSNAAIRRKKEASVISNRVVTSVMDADGSSTFTPPGSPKSRTVDTSRAGGNRTMRMPQKSMDDDEIDIDAIIKAPITSKKAQAPVAGKRDDADEPYSPGGSSDDDVQVVPLGVRDDDLKREMDEINRQIAAQKMEIAGLLSSETTSFGSGSNNLAPSLADISIPSNLQQILASIQSKPESPALPSSSSVTPSMVPPPPMIGSLARVIADDEEEYTPEPILCTRNTRDSQPSRLAQLSEAELLSMVPDDINIDNSNSSHSAEPPEKRPRWSEPPPPGLEGEYN